MNTQGQNNKIGLVFSILIIIVGLIVGAYYIFTSIEKTASLHTIRESDNGGTPKANIIDTAPKLPLDQKTAVVLMQSDSTYSKYLVPTATLQSFLKTIPPGSSVVSKGPAD